jgi:hypothetical protein
MVGSGGSGGAVSAPTSSKKSGSGTGWTNLQNYIGANAGNDAAMGGKIAGKIGDTASQVTTAGQGLSTKATADTAANTVTDQGVIQGLQSDPTKVDKKAFQTQVGATYKGPQDVTAYEEYAQGQQAGSKLNQKLDATKTAEGQGTLLKDIAGENYTRGLQGLDQFILSAGEQGKKSIADTQQQFGNVTNDWAALTGNLNQGFTRARETTEKTAADTSKAFEDVYGATKGAVTKAQDSLQGVNKARQDEVNNLQKMFASDDPKVQGDIAKRLNITPADLYYMRTILGFKPEEIIAYSGDRSLGDVVDPQAKARYEALLGLADRQSEFSFAGSGRGPQGATVKTDVVKAAQDAKAIRDAVTSKAREENDRRLKAQARIQSDIQNGNYTPEVAQATGLTEREFRVATTGQYSSGFDNIPVDFKMTAGRNLTAGDVATPEQRKQWDSLMKVLGSRDKTSLTSTGADNSLATFNVEDVRRAVAQGDATAAERNAMMPKFGQMLSDMNNQYTKLDSTPAGIERRQRLAAFQGALVNPSIPFKDKVKMYEDYQSWSRQNPTQIQVG